MNPTGIPCLYVTDDLTTAVMEVRPWIGSPVTVAKLATKRALNLVDFAVDVEFGEAGAKPLGELSAQEIEEFVWWSVNDAFSVPVTHNEDKADYAPTHFIAEAFRSKGHDGLLYKSSLGAGINLALFDLDAVGLVSREVLRVDRIEMHYSAHGDRMIEYRQVEHIDDPDDKCMLPN